MKFSRTQGLYLGLLVATSLLAPSASAQNYTVSIDGSQPVPPTGSPATGAGTMTLDGAKILSWNISFSGLTSTETAAHIHGPAPVGSNAGIQIGLGTGNPKVGSSGPLTPTQEADLNAGLYYVNIHSTSFPSGEIRGQILTAAPPAVPSMQNWAVIVFSGLLLLFGAFTVMRRS